jgi:hypothetical protein
MSQFTSNSVPEAIRAELLHRHLNSTHLSVDDHLVWLREQGYSVARESLHRYLNMHRDGELAAEQLRQDAIESEELMRLKCLEIAARLYKGDDQVGLLDLADSLVDWVITTDARKDVLV